jgi:Kyakuja-Dileera-Zisupton transposase
MNALQSSKACDVTGVVGIACARHGCYAPNALVDLFKGEQQKNVDFGLLKGIISTHVDPEQGLLLYYDIICQYIIYLQERIGSHLPFGLVVEAAIGLFHVHAHKDECFFRYASTFIPGAGVVAGEILESLWSTLNSISRTVRTATLAHRAEMLDDHTSDSNHKKMLGIVSSICKLNQKAIDMFEHAQEYYDNLTMGAGPTAVDKWKNDIETAEKKRQFDVKAMDMYAAKLTTDKEKNAEPAVGTSASALHQWMELSLAIEEKQ